MFIVIFCFLALEDHFQLLSEDKEVNADIKFVLTGPRAHIFKFQLLSEDKEVNADIKFVLTGPRAQIFKFESAPLGYEFRRLH